MRQTLRAIAVALLVPVAAACADRASTPEARLDTPATGAPPAPRSSQETRSRHLEVQGRSFAWARGGPFAWRGISAFRLAEMVARGRQSEVEAYLDWAASQQLTVVRVFAMAHHLFRLGPEDGLAALPRLLDLAAARNLHVEVVALVDTAEVEVDLDAHVRMIGEIAVRYPNTLVEIANEPGHPTQRAEVHRAARLQQLASLVPDPVPVALGSLEYDDGFAAADYATWHVPRESGDGGWGHVLRVADGADLLARFSKPLVSDEPIGAGPKFMAGRRDDSPARFAAAAAMTRFVGMHPTFHYEGGLQAIRPSGRELECFEAWKRGLDLVGQVPHDREEVLTADRIEPLANVTGARAAYGRMGAQDAWLLLVDPAESASVTWSVPWRAIEGTQVSGVRLFHARRQ